MTGPVVPQHLDPALPLAPGVRADTQPWAYSQATHRYRGPDGRWLGRATVLALRDGLVEAQLPVLDGLVARLAAGQLPVAGWVLAMRDLLRVLHVAQYTYGRGGKAAMTAADRGRLGALLRGQYGHLQAFAQEVADGRLSAAQAQARAHLYAGAARQSYERGQAASWGVRLPAHPADGSTECRSNCKCSWRLVGRADGAVEATWVRHAQDSCATCVRRATDWNPLVVQG